MIKVLLIGSNSTVAKKLYSNTNHQYQFISANSTTESNIQINLEKEIYDVKDIKYADIAINFIASFDHDSEDGAYKNEKINSLGSFTIMRLLKELNVKRLIHLSSISCFDNVENEYFGSYGLSKKHGEENLAYLSKLNNIEYIALRLSQIYDSEGDCRIHQPFLYNIIDKILEDKKIVFWGTRDVLRNFIHINDVVNILMKLIDSSIVGTYNVLGDKSYLISDIASMVFNILNLDSNISFDENKDNIKKVFIPNNDLLDSYIDYNNKTRLVDGLRDIIRGKK